MIELKCAKCKPQRCIQGVTDESLLPSYCPIKNFKDIIEKVKKKYKSKEIQKFYINSAITEKEGYDEKAVKEEGKIIPIRPRIREIAEFAQKMGFNKIGLAFCSGLSDEGGRAASILENHDLKIFSAICSCGAIDKTEAGISPEYKIRPQEHFEVACNPLFQAELLNYAQTEINVIVGLCVGHDMLFTMNSNAPVTTLVVKDRLTGHNPVISLYTKYHRDIV
jgi:uncharacterized metal-binding protein